MTKRAAPPAKKTNRDPKESAQATKPEDTFLPPLKPLPTLFKALIVGFALWLGVLLTLYFKTVYPLRHAPSTVAAPATTRS
jgi:hypothetical protein